MARKSPLAKIKDAADAAVTTVVGTVTETVKDPIGTGQKVVGQAVEQAVATVGAVTSRVGRKPAPPPHRPGPVAVPQEQPRKVEGDPVKPTATAPTTKAATKNVPAKKAAAKKTGAKKASAKKTGAKKTGAKKTGAKKTAAKKTPPPAAHAADPQKD